MKTYSGEKLKSLGYALVKVRLNDKVYELILQAKVERELKHLQNNGIIEPVFGQAALLQ